MWKSTDKCQFYECSANAIADNITEAKIVSYRKSCPPLQNCPSNKTYMKDCCTFCSFDQQPKNQSEFDDFVHWADKYDGEMSRDTYMRHPCRRECISGASPKVCEYIFVVRFKKNVFFFGFEWNKKINQDFINIAISHEIPGRMVRNSQQSLF